MTQKCKIYRKSQNQYVMSHVTGNKGFQVLIDILVNYSVNDQKCKIYRKSREANCMDMSSRPVPPNDTKPYRKSQNHYVVSHVTGHKGLQVSIESLGN